MIRLAVVTAAAVALIGARVVRDAWRAARHALEAT